MNPFILALFIVNLCYIASGCMYFLWITFDWQRTRGDGWIHRKENVLYLCYITIGAWPFLAALFFILYGDASSYTLIFIYTICTGLLYYGSALHLFRRSLVLSLQTVGPQKQVNLARYAFHNNSVLCSLSVLGVTIVAYPPLFMLTSNHLVMDGLIIGCVTLTSASIRWGEKKMKMSAQLRTH